METPRYFFMAQSCLSSGEHFPVFPVGIGGKYCTSCQIWHQMDLLALEDTAMDIKPKFLPGGGAQVPGECFLPRPLWAVVYAQDCLCA